MKKNKIYERISEEPRYCGKIDEAIIYCENILKGIPAEFPNYTLHDIDHSKRILDYIANILEVNSIQNYSYLHLYVIMLAALFHDTGMVVGKEEIESVKKRFSNEKGIKKIDEEVQNHFRKEHAKRAAHKIDEAKEKGFFNAIDGNSFSDDLKLICEAHNESVEWIEKNIVKTRTLGSEQYNPQQIAILLRLGDNLDIDNRRAPDYLAKALQIEGYSAEEWLKHLYITNYKKVDINDSDYKVSLTFEGSCDDDQEYAKILSFFDWFRVEISDANKLLEQMDSPYRFYMDQEIRNKIDTLNFESKLLEFTIEYSSIVTLLMGERIYGNRKAGLRELIQNSIDAVLVYADRIEEKKKSRYNPWIEIEVNTVNDTFSVIDNGIGMDMEIIEKYFFNIGKSYYKSEEYKKERKEYDAIGQYGIGFLACFMLTDKVALDTKTKDGQNIRLEFSKNCKYVTKKKNAHDYHDFVDGHGTKISMKASDIIGSVFKDIDELKNYLMELLLIEPYGYRLWLTYNEKEEEIVPDQNLEKKYVTEKDGIKLSFDLQQRPSVICDVNELGDFDDVYVVLSELDDSVSFFELNHLLVEISDDDKGNAHKDISVKKAMRYMPELLTCDDVDKYVNEFLFSHMYKDYNITYNIIKFLKDSQKIVEYKEIVDGEGISKAYEEYKNSLSEILVINLTDTKISFEMMKEMIDYSLDEVGNTDTVYNIEDFERYFPMCEIYVKAYYKDGFAYILDENVKNDNKLYCHGIRVNDDIVLPFVIEGMKIKDLMIDVRNNNNYTLNVSRDEFDEKCKKDLALNVIKIILSKLAEETIDDEFMIDGEIEFFRQFVEDISNIYD